VRRKIHGEDSEFAGDIRVREGVLTPDADVALAVAEDGGAKELVPGGRSDGEGGDDDRARPVSAGLGHKGVEEGGRGEGEEGLAVQLVAVGTAGVGPVWHRESVLGLGSRLGIAGEKPGEEGVRLRGEGIDSELPVEAPGKGLDPLAEERRADRPGPATSRARARESSSTPSSTRVRPGACRKRVLHLTRCWRRQERIAH
jgi:hypothetical protein